MQNNIYSFAALYFLSISFITFVITAADKIKAKKNKRRIRERTLFILAFMGGSLSEYITMKLIRHKTLHKRFMFGLPAIMILQSALIALLILWKNGYLQNLIQ